MKNELVTDAELQRAKDQLKVSIMLSLESTSARMSNVARQEIFFGRQFTLDEILDRIERVTASDVQRMAARSLAWASWPSPPSASSMA